MKYILFLRWPFAGLEFAIRGKYGNGAFFQTAPGTMFRLAELATSKAEGKARAVNIQSKALSVWI